MNLFIQELINRLINYLVKISKGETYEEKIEQLLRKTFVVVFFTLLLTTTMTFKYLVSSWYLKDLEKGITKIDQFMSIQQTQINQLFKVNADQLARIQSLKEGAREMLTDIHTLAKENQELIKENEELTKKKAGQKTKDKK